ncbi:hypothetical protein [Ottowia sp.]|uniref:hypothetical protein n=1 Tax=Ottowia sp. TaxID=1898956 RepID=UPI0039E5D6AA
MSAASQGGVRPADSALSAKVTGDTPITEAGKVATNLMAWCTYEIETLAGEVTLLGDECSASGENRIGALLRCYGSRIEALNSALMSFFGNDEIPVGDVHRELYRGAKPFDPKEYGAHVSG